MDSSLDFLQEGAAQVEKIGAKVIKLWFADTSLIKWCYPYNIKWSELNICNSVDMADCQYYRKVFDMDFTTIILETTTFDYSQPDYQVVWQDGMDDEEKARLENETYCLAKYLYETYNGTRKEFIIQNWEGDNMLEAIKWRYNEARGLYYKTEDGYNSACKESDAELRTRISGLIDWCNCRQRGIDKAREECQKRSDVTVRHAFEVSFTYLNSDDDGWPFEDTPLLIDYLIPYTDCDLYSYSSWMTHTMKRGQELESRLKMIQERVGDTYIDLSENNKVKSRRPMSRSGQKSKLMLGEYGSIEGMQYADTTKWGVGFTYETSRRHREVLQIQTEIAESFGLEFVVFWELYCNVYRGDLLDEYIDMTKGDQIKKNEHLQGNWLIRVDGTCTEGYKYLHGVCRPNEALYINEKFSENKTYKISGDNGGFEISGILHTENVPSNYTDRMQYNSYVKVSASADGKNFSDVNTEIFFTCHEETAQGTVTEAKCICKEEPDKGLRYFRISVDGSPIAFTDIKFYKPNKIINKK